MTLNKKRLSDDIQSFVLFDASKTPNIYEFIKRNLYELFVYRYALFNLINTNLSSRYRRSALGFFWSLLNPLLTMIIIAIVFSSLYKLPFEEFSLYLFSGLLPWNLVTSSLTGGSMAIINAEIYLKKMYVPKMLFPLMILGMEVVNFLFSLLSLFFLALLLGAKLSWSLLLLPLALLLLSLFLLGIVLVLSILTIFFRDLAHILQIGLLALFYLTPVLYPISRISGLLVNIIKFNPFYYFINLFHLIVYEAKMPGLLDWMICGGFAIVSMMLGVMVFYKKEKDVIYRL